MLIKQIKQWLPRPVNGLGAQIWEGMLLPVVGGLSSETPLRWLDGEEGRGCLARCGNLPYRR
jgi:hypothetical protein